MFLCIFFKGLLNKTDSQLMILETNLLFLVLNAIFMTILEHIGPVVQLISRAKGFKLLNY